jgi:RND superfamily putative drug exporter
MEVGNMAFIDRVYKTLERLRQEEGFPKGLEVGVTGTAAVGTDMLFASAESIRNTEWTTIVLVVSILLLVYRAPGLVVVPLLAIVMSFFVSCDLIAILARWSQVSGWFDYKVFKTTEIFIVVILFGAATDYCLFLIARYREELERGLAPAEAIQEALSRTGHALAGSAMTTILGLGTMLFADFGKYRSGGPTIALSLVVALAACLTAAPALLRALGRSVFWPFGVGRAKTGRCPEGDSPIFVGRKSGQSPLAAADSGAAQAGWRGWLWETIARTIVRHPGLILAGSFLLLAWPAYQGLSVPVTYDMLSELSDDRPSVQGMRLLERFFPVGETGPIIVLAHRPGTNFDGREARRHISLLSRELNDFTYVDSQGAETHPVLSVRSLTNPLGGPLTLGPFTAAARRNTLALRNPRARAVFLSAQPDYPGDVTRLDLVCQYPPFSHESRRLLGAIERLLHEREVDPSSAWHNTSFDLIGITPGIRDLEAVNTSDSFRIALLVSIAVLGVLVFLLRRPVISLYLIFTVLFGYVVSMGLTKLFFAWLFGATFQGLDWKLPTFLFVILVAVGEDYNIYLVTRVFEEQRRRGALEGLRFAVARTGGIITSCGVIMAGTFSSMLTGSLRSMFELGFSLALGVLLDTFIIRTILVPAFLALWARWFPDAAPAGGQQLGGPHFEAASDALAGAFAEADRVAG